MLEWSLYRKPHTGNAIHDMYKYIYEYVFT